MEAD
jgi:hypothetical protein